MSPRQNIARQVVELQTPVREIQRMGISRIEGDNRYPYIGGQTITPGDIITVDDTGGGYTVQPPSSVIDPVDIGAVDNAEPLITYTSSGSLSAERVLTAGANVTLDTGTPGLITVNAAGATGSGGAPDNASYLTLGFDGILTAERVLVAGVGLSLSDGGANGNATLNAEVQSSDLHDAVTRHPSSTSRFSLSGQQIRINEAELDDLTDVTISAPASAEVLRYNGSIWVNGDIGDIGGVPEVRTVTAGTGLTGGGALSSDITINVGAGNGITVSANDVALTTPGTITGSSTNSASGNHTHAWNADLTDLDDVTITTPATDDVLRYNGSIWVNGDIGDIGGVPEVRTVTAGTGLTGGGALSSNITLNVGAGDGITANANDIEVKLASGTPYLSFSSGGLYVDASTNIGASDSKVVASSSGRIIVNRVSVNGGATSTGDFEVTGSDSNLLLFADVSQNRVGIGLNAPGNYKLHVGGKINGTGNFICGGGITVGAATQEAPQRVIYFRELSSALGAVPSGYAALGVNNSGQLLFRNDTDTSARVVL